MAAPSGFDFSHLNPQQRLDLIGQLWDSLTPEEIPISQEVMAELDRRSAAYHAGEMELYSWEEVRDRVLRRSEEVHAGRVATSPWAQVRARLFRQS